MVLPAMQSIVRRTMKPEWWLVAFILRDAAGAAPQDEGIESGLWRDKQAGTYVPK
jgi:hypothetical protein